MRPRTRGASVAKEVGVLPCLFSRTAYTLRMEPMLASVASHIQVVWIHRHHASALPLPCSHWWVKSFLRGEKEESYAGEVVGSASIEVVGTEAGFPVVVLEVPDLAFAVQ